MNKTEARYLSMQQFVNFYPPLGAFAELKPSIENIAKQPFDIMRTYGTYRSYLNRLINPTPDDMQILHLIQEQYPNHRGALHFIEKFGPDRMHSSGSTPGLKSIMDQAVYPFSSTYDSARQDLISRMTAAQEITDDPHDAKGTEYMIYGYRVIKDTPNDRYRHDNYTKAQLHFVLCHFLERALFAHTTPQDPSIPWKKDDFLGALGDMILLVNEQTRKLGEHHEITPEYALWTRDKQNGGLGWINSKYVYIAGAYVHEKLMRGRNRTNL